MDNVATFKTARETSTALVVVDQMSPKEALAMHTSIKNQGRGSVRSFIKNDTPYETYGNYYYQLKKKGVAPFKPRTSGTIGKVGSTQNALEARVQQLEMQLSAAMVTPAQRSLEILQNNLSEITTTSRKFLCSIISYDRATLSPKQEKWLSDLETRFS